MKFWLFHDVKNVSTLREMMTENLTEFAFLDASWVFKFCVVSLFTLVKQITSEQQVLAASIGAISSHLNSTLRTASLQLELVFQMSPTKKIRRSLETFGLSDETSNVLVVGFKPSEDATCTVKGLVLGDEVPLSDLSGNNNPASAIFAAIKAEYKITDSELQLGSLDKAVISRIAAQSIW